MANQPILSMNDVDFLTPEEVAEKLRVCRAKAYRMIQEGEIPSIHFGKSVRVLVEDFLAYINKKRAE
jgi:excisionase family DNA binding protein